MSSAKVEESSVLNVFMGFDYKRIVKGEGVYLIDEEGNRILDACGGALVSNLGHGNAEMAEAMRDQAQQIAFVYRFTYTTPQLESLTRKMCDVSNGVFEKVFLCNGGSEAVEIAIKLAATYHANRGKPSKWKVISRWQSYHGSTMATMSLGGFTARRKYYDPYLQRGYHIPPAYCYRCPYGKTPETCSLQCADALEEMINREGPETISAFLAEPLGGAALGGAMPRADYFERVREICDKYDILLMLDEVMTGFGRTGKWFGYEHFNISPDIIMVGKGLSGGYYPLSGVMAAGFVLDAIASNSGIFPTGYTYAGNPVGCAVGTKAIEILERDNLIDKSAEQGAYLLERLQRLYQHPTVGDIRGTGLMLGIEFVKNKETKEPFAAQEMFSNRLLMIALEQGLGVLASGGIADGQKGDLILLGPPFNISKEEIDELVEKLDRVITIVEEQLL